jgi:hypothetical protein
MQIPGPNRPARPLRCSALAAASGGVTSRVMALPGSYSGARTKPASITTRTPSMVRLVSAMAVASTSLRTPAGGGRNGEILFLARSWPYSGRENGSRQVTVQPLHARRRISPSPGRKTSSDPLSAAAAYRESPAPDDPATACGPVRCNEVHRKICPGQRQHRRIAQQLREGLRIERGRHHQHAQVLAQHLLAFTHQRQPEIGLQRALVEFIKNDDAVVGQFLVLQ